MWLGGQITKLKKNKNLRGFCVSAGWNCRGRSIKQNIAFWSCLFCWAFLLQCLWQARFKNNNNKKKEKRRSYETAMHLYSYPHLIILSFHCIRYSKEPWKLLVIYHHHINNAVALLQEKKISILRLFLLKSYAS